MSRAIYFNSEPDQAPPPLARQSLIRGARERLAPARPPPHARIQISPFELIIEKHINSGSRHSVRRPGQRSIDNSNQNPFNEFSSGRHYPAARRKLITSAAAFPRVGPFHPLAQSHFLSHVFIRADGQSSPFFSSRRTRHRNGNPFFGGARIHTFLVCLGAASVDERTEIEHLFEKFKRKGIGPIRAEH